MSSSISEDLDEYRGNDFIAALPPILSDADAYKSLVSMPVLHEHERSMEARLRKHCVLRLGRYFDPLPRHVKLSTAIEAIVRQGYLGRNPADGGYRRQLVRSAGLVKQGSFFGGFRTKENTANSFCLIGCSGVGKSKCIEKVLSRYEQLRVHSNREHGRIVQLTYVKLDCPHLGSENVLCDAFFSYVDGIVGADYLSRFGGNERRIGTKLLAMAHVASVHAVGMLIIDEIQHLVAARNGPAAMLNFLVTLENTIGIPVVLVGTLAATPLVQGTFRQGRRASGFGSMVWDRLPRGPEWTHWASRLWAYQWTASQVPWSEEVDVALHDESQGVMDLAIKLHVMTQWRVLTVGKQRGGETLSTELLRRVAREEFQIVRPMIEALRRSDAAELRRYDDLLPLHARFGLALQELGVNPIGYVGLGSNLARGAPEGASRPAQPSPDLTSDAALAEFLKSRGMADDVVRIALAEARKSVAPGDDLGLLAAVTSLLSAGAKNGRKLKRRAAVAPGDTVSAFCNNDLRSIIATGREQGLSPRAALVRSGTVMPPDKVSSLGDK